MKRLVYLLGVVSLLIGLNSCVDIFDEIILHTDGSGTYKYTINLSASKVKINSVLALDSIDGQRVPKLPEIKEKIALYKQKLEDKEGISNVKVDSNYDDFVFKFSCDFSNVTALQNAVRDIVKEESRDKNDPIFNETWLTWDGQQLVRSIPNFKSPINRLKAEDQEALKNGKYISVTRFDKPVSRCDNPQAQINPSKTAVMVKSSTHAVTANPSILKNTITLE
jgi:hypothetical protein